MTKVVFVQIVTNMSEDWTNNLLDLEVGKNAHGVLGSGGLNIAAGLV